METINQLKCPNASSALMVEVNKCWDENKIEFGPILQLLADKYYDEVTEKLFDGDDSANVLDTPNLALRYAHELFEKIFDNDDVECVYHYVKIRD